VPGGVRVVDEEPSARGRVGCKRQPEKAALTPRADLAAKIEEVSALHDAVNKSANAPALLHDELDGAIGRILDERHGLIEPGRMHARAESGLRMRAAVMDEYGGREGQHGRDTSKLHE
jgi:hypothetical protein